MSIKGATWLEQWSHDYTLDWFDSLTVVFRSTVFISVYHLAFYFDVATKLVSASLWPLVKLTHIISHEIIQDDLKQVVVPCRSITLIALLQYTIWSNGIQSLVLVSPDEIYMSLDASSTATGNSCCKEAENLVVRVDTSNGKVYCVNKVSFYCPQMYKSFCKLLSAQCISSIGQIIL